MKRLLGSHVSMKAPSFYLGAVEEALMNGANTLMLYTGAPQNNKRVPIAELRIKEALSLCLEKGLSTAHFVAHAPYLINLGNSLDSEKWQFSQTLLKQELERVAAMQIPVLVLHPGSHLGAGVQNGLDAIVKALNNILQEDHSPVKIALETMAGKGFELGKSLEEIAYIIEHVEKKDRLGVCLDTCHLSDAGYDVHDPNSIIKELDRLIGFEKLLVIHLNDSKNERGSHKDRHENIGYGTIGFAVLDSWFSHPLLEAIPFILETPYINKEKSPYKKEISMLRNHCFDPLDRELW